MFDLKGQYNQVRLGNPIEVPYGRNRLWPSIAAREYNKYVNNDQYRYSLYCLGQGSYGIEALQIEDTALAQHRQGIVKMPPCVGFVHTFRNRSAADSNSMFDRTLAT